MVLYVLDKKFKFVGIVDEYTSLIWTNRYYDAGDFEMYVKAEDEAIETLKEDYYIIREDKITEKSYGEAAIIQTKEIKTDEETGSYLKAAGGLLDKILERRIVWNQTTLTGNAEECIRRLIEENIINPEVPERKIENFVMADKKGFEEELEDFDLQSAGDSLLDVVKSICQMSDMGFRMELKRNGTFLFELYRGTDRSYAQNENVPVVFSPEFDNLNNSDYTYNQENYKNAAVVFGEGEGASQRVVTIGEATGIERREVKIDGSGVSSNGSIITLETYMEMLKAYGESQMQEYKIAEGMSGDVLNDTTYKINEDFFIGDKVAIENEFKIGANTRVIEVIESWDETGEKIVPTFDTWEVEQ